MSNGTDECEYSPGFGPCGHCYDGGACLPGGCGVDGCKRCGEPCPYCKGTCELAIDQVPDPLPAVETEPAK